MSQEDKAEWVKDKGSVTPALVTVNLYNIYFADTLE